DRSEPRRAAGTDPVQQLVAGCHGWAREADRADVQGPRHVLAHAAQSEVSARAETWARTPHRLQQQPSVARARTVRCELGRTTPAGLLPESGRPGQRVATPRATARLIRPAWPAWTS